MDLFLDELSSRGMEQIWFAPSARHATAPIQVQTSAESRKAHVCINKSPEFLALGRAGRVLARALRPLFETVAMLRAVGKGADIIQVRDQYIAAVIGMLVARATRRRFCVWLSFPFPEYQIDESRFRAWPARLYLHASGHCGFWLLYRIAMPRADMCFVQSEQMLEDLRSGRRLDPSRMHVVPMGISRRGVDLGAATVLASGKSRDPKPNRTVIYVGTLVRLRRLPLMIEAFELLAKDRDDVRFVVVGDSPDRNDRQALEDQAARGALRGRIRFTGWLPMSNAWKEIAGADIGVSPFHMDRVLRVASPTKLVEYWAFGKPVVANEHPEHVKMIEACGGGVIVDWSARGFAEGIGALLDDPDRGRRMGLSGRQWVLGHRTYDRIADDVLSVYEGLAKRRSGTAHR